MDDIFSDPKSLIRGANEDIDELERDIRAFFDENSYAHTIEYDAKNGSDIHKIKLTKKFPERLSRRAAHIAADLRSALDQAGYACAVAGGMVDPKCTYFPFAETAAELDSMKGWRCKHLPPDIFALFRSYNAHRGGDDFLWSLNKIANSRKHRTIVPIGQTIGSVFQDSFYCKELVKNFSIPPQWDRAKNELILCEVEHGANPQYKLQLTFYVAFGKIDVVEGQPVDSTLRALSAKVAEIVSATELAAKRIGLM